MVRQRSSTSTSRASPPSRFRMSRGPPTPPFACRLSRIPRQWTITVGLRARECCRPVPRTCLAFRRREEVEVEEDGGIQLSGFERQWYSALNRLVHLVAGGGTEKQVEKAVARWLPVIQGLALHIEEV